MHNGEHELLMCDDSRETIGLLLNSQGNVHETQVHEEVENVQTVKPEADNIVTIPTEAREVCEEPVTGIADGTSNEMEFDECRSPNC